jgi:hypothetical protein
MTKDDFKLSMPKLTAALGQEHVYISASDDQRHSDSEIVIGAFIVHLVATAAKAAIEEIAKAAGKSAWPKISELFHKLESSAFSDIQSQTKAVASADRALCSLGRELTETTARDFIETTRQGMENSLIARHFPPAKARRISKELATILKERLDHD